MSFSVAVGMLFGRRKGVDSRPGTGRLRLAPWYWLRGRASCRWARQEVTCQARSDAERRSRGAVPIRPAARQYRPRGANKARWSRNSGLLGRTGRAHDHFHVSRSKRCRLVEAAVGRGRTQTGCVHELPCAVNGTLAEAAGERIAAFDSLMARLQQGHDQATVTIYGMV